MLTIKNREEIVKELAGMLKQFDKDFNSYQTDVYAYYNSETQEVSLDTFVNVGGNSWRDDDHTTIYCDKQRYEGVIDSFSTIEEIADAIDMNAEQLVETVAAEEEIDAEDVEWYDVAKYAEEFHSDKIYSAYEDILDGLDSEYYDRAEEIISNYENEE